MRSVLKEQRRFQAPIDASTTESRTEKNNNLYITFSCFPSVTNLKDIEFADANFINRGRMRTDSSGVARYYVIEGIIAEWSSYTIEPTKVYRLSDAAPLSMTSLVYQGMPDYTQPIFSGQGDQWKTFPVHVPTQLNNAIAGYVLYPLEMGPSPTRVIAPGMQATYGCDAPWPCLTDPGYPDSPEWEDGWEIGHSGPGSFRAGLLPGRGYIWNNIGNPLARRLEERVSATVQNNNHNSNKSLDVKMSRLSLQLDNFKASLDQAV